MSDYLLLKITVLEHASVSSNCRVGEDIITIICDPPLTPTPTQTQTRTPTNTITATITATNTPTNSLTPTPTSTSSTPTPTPTVTSTNTVTPTVTSSPTQTSTVTPTASISFANTLTIPSDINYISGNGLTFVGNTGDSLSYMSQSGSDLPATMNISVSGVVRASVVFPNSVYLNRSFRFTLKSNNTSYIGNFIPGTINFN